MIFIDNMTLMKRTILYKIKKNMWLLKSEYSFLL